MIFDIVWKLFRKSLSKDFYEKLRKSKFGRPYKYLSISTYKDIFTHYQNQGIEFDGKIVLELGSGLQFFTSFFFLLNGVSKVILVDPVFKNADYKEILNAQLKDFRKHYIIPDDKLSSIEVYSSLDEVSCKNEKSIDCVVSHFVLEHIKDLNHFFTKVNFLLKIGGLCYSFVDLSDHTYQLFDSRKLTRWIYRNRIIYHLRYSDSFFNKISDSRTWVNRQLFPTYKKLAAQNGFEVLSNQLIKCIKTKIHKDIYRHLGNFDCSELYVSHFSLLLKKTR